MSGAIGANVKLVGDQDCAKDGTARFNLYLIVQAGYVSVAGGYHENQKDGEKNQRVGVAEICSSENKHVAFCLSYNSK